MIKELQQFEKMDEPVDRCDAYPDKIWKSLLKR